MSNGINVLMFIGIHPESGRVRYLSTHTGPNAHREARNSWAKAVGALSVILGDPAVEGGRGPMSWATWNAKSEEYGEAAVTIRMEERGEE